MNMDYRRGFEDALELVLEKADSMSSQDRKAIIQMVGSIRTYRLEEIESYLR